MDRKGPTRTHPTFEPAGSVSAKRSVMPSLKLLFTCPVTGEDVSVFVFEPVEKVAGKTITLTCEKCSSSHSWPAEEGRIVSPSAINDDTKS